MSISKKKGYAHLWGVGIRDWRSNAHESLIAIFPSPLEANTFDNTTESFSLELFDESDDKAFLSAESVINKSIQILMTLKDEKLGRYDDAKGKTNVNIVAEGALPKDKDVLNGVTAKYADILLVTVTEVEAKAILSLFPDSQPYHAGEQTYHNLGIIEGAKIFMVQSEMGSGGPSGAALTIEESIRLLNPSAVIMVGIAFGIAKSTQKIGDILVSKQLIQYELQRIGTSITNEYEIFLRGNCPSASPRMLQRFRAAATYWQIPPVVKFGPVLSGEKLIDNQDFRDQLLKLTHEAIGGEMEGSGLYAAAQRKKVDWIVVKAICDWADGSKHQDKEQRQLLAAENAVRFTLHVLKQGGFEETSTPNEFQKHGGTGQSRLNP